MAVKSSIKKPVVMQDSYSAADSALLADSSFRKEILDRWAMGTLEGKGGYVDGGEDAIAQAISSDNVSLKSWLQ